MTARWLTGSVLLLISAVLPSAQSWKNTAPESFRAAGEVTAAAGGAASWIDISIKSYTSDGEHDAMVAALKGGGNEGFIAELKKAPAIGAVTVGPRSVAVRWAREQAHGESRRIVVVTDGPVFFAGAGAVDAKPTAGYDLAVLEFTVDSVGFGRGTMAPAARVKPGGPAGVDVEDYSGKRVTLVTVTRNLK